MDDSIIPHDPAARKRITGGILLFALAGACAYFFMYLPVREALHTGTLHYYVKGVLLPPMCGYMAMLVLFAKIENGELRRRNSKGRAVFTRKGWWVIGGAVVVIGLWFAGFFWYLSALGFHDA